MREQENDVTFLRQTLRSCGVRDVVYAVENHYDGGYEVRVGGFDFFVEYEIIDAKDTDWICKKATSLDLASSGE